MMNSSRSLVWGDGVNVLQLFVHRYRRLYLCACGYLLLLVALANAPRTLISPFTVGMLTPPFILLYFATLAAFANPDTDLAAETSGYPAYLLRQPVKSLTLALSPMLGVTVWGGLIWLVYVLAILRPVGHDAPLWWPIVLISALGLTLQAIIWIPLRAGWIRLALAISLPTFIVFFGTWAGGSEWPAERVAGVYAIEGLLAGLTSIHAVNLARTTGAMRSKEKERVFKDRARPRRAFRSAEEAQFWLEWKKQGRFLPILTGFMLVFLSLPLFFQPYLFETDFAGYIKVNPWMNTWLPMLPWIPLLFATVLGLGANRSYLRSPEGNYHLFFATRPLSNESMVRAKFSAVCMGVAVSWLIMLSIGIGWLLFPASDGIRTAPAISFLIERATPTMWLKLIGLVTALGFWTWRNQTVGLFVDFVPVPSIRGLYAAGVTFVGGTIFSLYVSNGQFLRREDSSVVVAVLLGLALVAKLGLAIAVAIRLLSIRPESRRTLWIAGIAWLAWGALAAAGAAYTAEQMRTSNSSQPLLETPVPILAGFLLFPLVRPLAARLAIEAGRHRT